MTDKEIMSLDVSELFSSQNLDKIFEIADRTERERTIGLFKVRANTLKIAQAFKPVIDSYIKKYSPEEKEENQKVSLEEILELGLETNKYNLPRTTIDNFVKIIDKDLYFMTLKYNALKETPEHENEGKTEEWTDADDSKARNYIEKKYKLHHVQKCKDAFNIVFKKREYHPIIQLIEGIEWDGVNRIETFLINCAKCEDTPYTREVSRLIFAGGINRIYDKGCKFDEVVVITGNQGAGKSTLIKWLAMKEEFFTEITEMDGQRSMEALQGAWICEIGELLALTKSKEAEAVKSFISRQNDRYRPPYGERVTDHKRQCIFIGTTNKEQFLTDPTGSRRFYPVRMQTDGDELYEAQDVVKEYIKQCWAEARERYKQGNFPPHRSRELEKIIKKEQENATEDDYRVGMIQDFLETRTRVCIIMIWKECLNEPILKPSKKDSAEIGQILNNMPDWEKQEQVARFGQYGLQKYWKKKKIKVENREELPF